MPPTPWMRWPRTAARKHPRLPLSGLRRSRSSLPRRHIRSLSSHVHPALNARAKDAPSAQPQRLRPKQAAVTGR